MSTLNKFTQKKAVHLWPITVLRVYTGVFFAKYGFAKISGGFSGNNPEGFVSSKLESSFGIISPFLESVVLPNKAIFAITVSWGGGYGSAWHSSLGWRPVTHRSQAPSCLQRCGSRRSRVS
jgi:uncharacterized membrane protein YphA (DoxX/SURF4 family)